MTSEPISGWLRRIMARVEAGHLGDEERAAQAESERLRREQEEREHRWAVQEGHLSPEHVKKARLLLAGKLQPVSAVSKQLARATERDRYGSFLLVGPTGAGKTTAAHAYALGRIRAGWTAWHVTQGGWKAIAMHEERREELLRADLVILDQLHKLKDASGQVTPKWIRDGIDGLIDDRYNRPNAQTIGIATIPVEELEARLDAETIERFKATLATTETSYRQRGA